VAAPNDLHEPYTVAAARAGKHVLCEKPLARDSVEAQRMIAACVAAGVRLGTAFQMRFHPAHQQIRDLVQRGALGTIRQGRVQFGFLLGPERRTWRMEERVAGGPLFDVGSHCVDLLSYITGQAVTAVSAVLARQLFVEYSVEDAAILNLTLAGGALAQVNVAFNTPFAVTSLELQGSAGSVRTLGTLGQVPAGEAIVRDGTGEQPLQWEPQDLYAAEIQAFAAAVTSATPLGISGEAGLTNLRVLTAALQSAREGGRLVEVNIP
jgi:1,5-anhydro-D-fructose reductase (1,5-anhydro-D-mannitol-forming)